MALDEATKSEILELLKASAPAPGMSKDEVTAMLNGLDKKQTREFQTLQTSIEQFSGFAKIFEGIKPKKLVKAISRLGKKSEEDDEDEEDDVVVKPKPGEQPKPGEDAQNLKDPYAGLKSKKFKKLEDKIKNIETERDEAKKDAEKSERLSSIRVFMADMPWVKTESYELAFAHYSGRVERDPKSNKLVIKLADGDFAEFTKDFVREDVSNRFDFALKPPDASGSGISRGDGRKPGTISLDDDLTDPAVSTAFAKTLSKMLPGA